MAEKVIRKHQCLMDFALQEGGDITALFELATINGIGCTDLMEPGTMLKVPTIVEKKVVVNYAAFGIEPATLDDENNIPGGIGFMGIGINFKVS